MMVDVQPGLRVLIVEDEFLIALDIQAMVTEAGCSPVALASNAATAQALLDSKQIDAVLLDINLNETKSFPLAASLRERGIPFVFISGYDEQVVPPEYKSISILKKPFSLADLQDLLKKLAAGPGGPA